MAASTPESEKQQLVLPTFSGRQPPLSTGLGILLIDTRAGHAVQERFNKA
ncbi:hypothetical protein LPJ38_27020 [Bradyrhizobium daqingense]|nr:hypothetical protein [Bradyrhizobium daqingense]UFS87277.1 hypothetical protein LPJ38_27020 [Bradyrhizobium daqingense]